MMITKILEKNQSIISSIEGSLAAIVNSEEYKNSSIYISVCDYLGVKEIVAKEELLFITTRPLNIDIFLQTLSEERLKNLVRSIISHDGNFKYLSSEWKEKFIAELSSNRDLIMWIKKKINDLSENEAIQKEILGGYYFENDTATSIVRQASISDFLSGRSEEDLSGIKNFINKITARNFEKEKESGESYPITTGLDAKLASAALSLELEDEAWLTGHDVEKRAAAVNAVINEIKTRIDVIEEKCQQNGIDYIRMLKDLLQTEKPATFYEIKQAADKADFGKAVEIIQFFEMALSKIETLSSYVPNK